MTSTGGDGTGSRPSDRDLDLPEDDETPRARDEDRGGQDAPRHEVGPPPSRPPVDEEDLLLVTSAAEQAEEVLRRDADEDTKDDRGSMRLTENAAAQAEYGAPAEPHYVDEGALPPAHLEARDREPRP